MYVSSPVHVSFWRTNLHLAVETQPYTVMVSTAEEQIRAAAELFD